MTTEAAAKGNSDPYLALGLRPFINCCSVRTIHGGSLMLPSVRAAVAAASQRFVNLDELMEAAGARIAELTGAEWGMVTCGSAAALALATAGCVAGNDPAAMLRLPFTDGMANRVLIMRGHRFAYDQAIRMAGTHMVECDDEAALVAALEAGNVAMICVLGKTEDKSPVRLERIVELARPQNVPILVDAASELIEKPSPWLTRGADLVVYSGGKFLRGPQTSGLLLGKKALVKAAWHNASPHHAFGRPMKVSKEDVIGLVAALEYWFGERDSAAEEQRWSDDLATIAKALQGLDGIETTVVAPRWTVRVPSLMISWDETRYGITNEGLRQRLLDGEPRIMLDDMASVTTNSLRIEPFNLQPGEARMVGLAISRAFQSAARLAQPHAVAPALDVSGEWELDVRFLKGGRRHRVTLEQQGTDVTGRQESNGFSGGVQGQVSASVVRLIFDGEHEGSTIFYTLEGEAAPSRMTGTVLFGAANGTNRGVLNLRQHGSGTWEARRPG
ncbi:MAG: PLP-dependent transferase [Acetobacteraceae bacterium]|nr:PLP-dependent transferase [Acetobacteraceae bacterium]